VIKEPRVAVDLLYSEAMNLIVNSTNYMGVSPEWRVRAALMVHYLERIALAASAYKTPAHPRR
jgi:hypothetical protein